MPGFGLIYGSVVSGKGSFTGTVREPLRAAHREKFLPWVRIEP
jgi:hypothetical protein